MRICTFNVENLYTRFLFAKGLSPRELAKQGFTSKDLRFRVHDPPAKMLTAKTMLATGAEVFALQEVEGLDILKQFRDRYLGGRQAFPHLAMVDGNDARRMDVAVLSKHPITHIRSWQHLWDNERDRAVFDRDCLEVDVLVPKLGTLTLFVNHFKSMRSHGHGSGRALTRKRRLLQSQQVIDIIRQRFPNNTEEAPFLVCGDLNDYTKNDKQGKSGLDPLFDSDLLVNVTKRLPDEERWTHYFSSARHLHLDPAYRQLDYLLPSKRLAAVNSSSPQIVRLGMPGRAKRYTGERLEGVGHHRPKASDHCPLVWEIKKL